MNQRISELEAQIARDDLVDDPLSRWRAADAQFEKAESSSAPDRARELRQRLIKEFAADPNPDVAAIVAWAREADIASELSSRRRRWRQRN